MNTFRPGTPAVALIGFAGGDLDWETVESRVAAERVAGGLRDPSMRSVATIGMLYAGSGTRDRSLESRREIHTLNNMSIELRAGRHRVTGDPSGTYLSGERWVEWARLRRQAAMEEDLPPRIVSAVKAGDLLTQREWRYRLDPARDRNLEHEVVRAVPSEVIDDILADWDRWPGRRFY